jgi:hypothetical protein
MEKINYHYKKRYDRLIEHYQQNLPEGFVEKHHIIPKCMGGNDDNSNIILIPTRSHFIAHYILHKSYPENKKLAHAFAMMGVCNNYQHRSSKLYEKSKTVRSLALKGVPRPEWVKEKLRKPKSSTVNYKKPKSKEHAAAISKSLKGKKKTKESIEAGIKSRKKYFENLKIEFEKRKIIYIDLFKKSGLTRQQFYSKHPEISRSILKKYLTGILNER